MRGFEYQCRRTIVLPAGQPGEAGFELGDAGFDGGAVDLAVESGGGAGERGVE